VYSDTGTLGLNVRIRMPGQVFIASGPGILVREGDPYCHMAFLNSRVASYLIRALSPKLTISAGYIARLPFPASLADHDELRSLSRRCVELKSAQLTQKVGNIEYTGTAPVLNQHADGDELLSRMFLADLKGESQRLACEARIDEIVARAFSFSEPELSAIHHEVGRPAGLYESRALSCKADALDKMAAAALSSNCQYRAGRRRVNHLGCDALLEAFSQEMEATPSAIYEEIARSINAFVRTKAMYLEDVLHKLALDEMGMHDSRHWRAKTLKVATLCARLRHRAPWMQDSMKRYLPQWPGIRVWLTDRLASVHDDAFFGRPVLSVDADAISIGVS